MVVFHHAGPVGLGLHHPGALLGKGHHLHALGIPRRLGLDHRRVDDQHPGSGGPQQQLGILRQVGQIYQRRFGAESPRQLFAAGLGLVAGHLHLGGLAVFKNKAHIAAVPGKDRHGYRHLAGVHAQPAGHIVAHHAGLGVLKFADAGFIHLPQVGKEHQLGGVGGVRLLGDGIPFLELLLAAHPQRLRRDLLEVALPGKEYPHRIIRGRFLRLLAGLLHLIQHLGPARLAVVLGDLPQLVHDDGIHLAGAAQRILHVGDLAGQAFDLRGTLEDVFPVQVPQLDLRHELRLRLIDAEADHQVGDDLGLLLGLPHNLHGLIDIQQDLFQSQQQMQLLLAALQVVVNAPADALPTERCPFLQQFPHAQHPGRPGNQHVKVAAEAVLQRRHAEQLLHQPVGIGAALAVDGQLQASQVGLVAHIADLPDLPLLDQIHDLIHDGFHGGRRRDLGDLDAVVGLIVGVTAAHPHRAPSGGVDLFQLRLVVQQDAAARKIRGDQRVGDLMLRVPDQRRGRLAHLRQVKGADIAGHSHRNAGIGVHQHRREGHRQQRRLPGGIVVVVRKVHRVLVDVGKQLGAYLFQPDFGIAGGGIGHIPGVGLAEVALAVHIRHQQRLVAAGQPHHRFVDGGVAVGVQPHGLPHHVGGFDPSPVQQAHLVHGVQQLAVRRLKAVDLRDRPGNDDAHGVGHIVFPQRFGNGLRYHLPGPLDVPALYLAAVDLRFLFLSGWQKSFLPFGLLCQFYTFSIFPPLSAAEKAPSAPPGAGSARGRPHPAGQ